MADIILKDVSFPKDDDILSVDIYSDNKAKCYSWSSKWIDAIPVDEAAPVRRGKWEQRKVFEAKGCVEELQSAFCPVCQRYHTTPYSYYFTDYNFCPNCGAKMEVDK